MVHRTSAPFFVATLALACGLAQSSTSAQIVLFEAYGVQPGDSFGRSFDAAGDVNADGFDDLVVGRPKGLGPDEVYYGYVTVHSGLDGSVLWEIECPIAMVAGAGDVDGDGHDDIVAGSAAFDLVGQNSGLVQVYSGADASLLWEFFGNANGINLGREVSRIGDVNGDGRADILASAPNGNRVYVWSGADGANLVTLQWTQGGAFGSTLSGAGDVNGDGAGDFIVGFAMASADKALVYSGADGSLLLELEKPYAEAGWWANAVGGAGDVDGDGHDDLIVGALGDTTFFPNGGMACVMSGADGSVIHTFYGWGAQHFLGQSVDGAGDVNGDGTPDLIVGSPGTPNAIAGSDVGQILVYSGSDGALIRQFSPHWYEQGASLGQVVKGVGDLNADGFDDVGGGAPNNDEVADQAGSLLVLSLRHFVREVEPDEVIFSVPTRVSILGGGFTPDAPIAVEFDGLSATDVEYVSESRIDCTTPVGSEDALVGVSLTQHGLTSAEAAQLTFGGAHIESLWPRKGSMFGNEEVLISGKNFVDDGSVTVTFGLSLTGTVLAVFEPDAILVRTPSMGADEGVQVTVTSSGGTDTKLAAYAFEDRWITPKTASIAGGTIITMTGNVQPTTLEDTQAWIGGIPAEVATVTPTGFEIVVPAVESAPDEWLNVLVHNSNGNQGAPASFHYTPTLDLTTEGNVFLGYDLAGHAGVAKAHGVVPTLSLWLIDPTVPAPGVWPGRPQSKAPGAAASGTGASSAPAPVTGTGSSLPYTPPLAPAGALQGKPLALVLHSVPLSLAYGNWGVDIGALDPFLIGTTLSFQGLVTGDSSPHGAFTNVMSFVVE
jgi:hypothetical protein